MFKHLTTARERMVSLRDDMGRYYKMGLLFLCRPFEGFLGIKRLVNWLTELMSIHLKELINRGATVPSLPDNEPGGGTEERRQGPEHLRLSKRSHRITLKAGAVDRRKLSIY
jgi:hypothetical protein